MKSFIVPRGIAVNAGGTAEANAKEFKVVAEVGSPVYGLCSNKFLDEEFKTVGYETTFKQIDADTFCYDEDSLIEIKGQKDIFHHTEKNTMVRVKLV